MTTPATMTREERSRAGRIGGANRKKRREQQAKYTVGSIVINKFTLRENEIKRIEGRGAQRVYIMRGYTPMSALDFDIAYKW